MDAWLRRSPEKEPSLDRDEASAMVRLVLERAELFHTPDSEAYATIEFDGHRENTSAVLGLPVMVSGSQGVAPKDPQVGVLEEGAKSKRPF